LDNPTKRERVEKISKIFKGSKKLAGGTNGRNGALRLLFERPDWGKNRKGSGK